jgi:DHA2 family multidrug resistance protein
VAYLGLTQEKSNAVAGLVNFVRNMGASVGTSAVTTILARRAQFHQVMLASHTGMGNSAFRDSASSLAARFRQEGAGRPQMKAYAMLYESIKNQASTLSYIDAFWILSIAAGIMFFLSFALKKNNPRGPRAQAPAH